MLSVIIPVYNEQDTLPSLFKRCYTVLDALNTPYEIIFTNDGSTDESYTLLHAQHMARPDVTTVIDFEGNYGQHMAIIAGFENANGDYCITLDADLQNPPEEIGKILDALRKGHDVVGTYRANRQDSFFRTHASCIINAIRRAITNIEMRDQGCMLRGYSKNIVHRILKTNESNMFIPATAQSYAKNPIEIEVTHQERAFGHSKYSLYNLIRLNFDLMTGYSLVPLQIFTLFGVFVSMGSFALFVLLMYRRVVLGAEAEGVFTLFAILFGLMGVMIIGLGILGEYVGRIYQQIRGRPRFEIRTIHASQSPSKTHTSKISKPRSHPKRT